MCSGLQRARGTIVSPVNYDRLAGQRAGSVREGRNGVGERGEGRWMTGGKGEGGERRNEREERREVERWMRGGK